MKINLTDLAQKWFTLPKRQRGNYLFNSGSVRILYAGSAGINAEVKDGSIHQVDVMLTKKKNHNVVASYCDCDDYVDSEACCHIWALLKEIDTFDRLKSNLPMVYEALVDDDIFEPDEDAGEVIRYEWPAWEDALASLDAEQRVIPLSLDTTALKKEKETRINFTLICSKATVPGYQNRSLSILMEHQELLKSGRWSSGKVVNFLKMPSTPSNEDLLLISLILSSTFENVTSYSNHGLSIRTERLHAMLAQLCASEKLMAKVGKTMQGPMTWDGDVPYTLELAFEPDDPTTYRLTGILMRPGEERSMENLSYVAQEGLFFEGNTIKRLSNTDMVQWLRWLLHEDDLRIPHQQFKTFVSEIIKRPGLPALRLPPSSGIDIRQPAPVPELNLLRSAGSGAKSVIPASLSFTYDGYRFPPKPHALSAMNIEGEAILLRDTHQEKASSQRLRDLGVKFQHSYIPGEPQWRIPAGSLPTIIKTLNAEGWSLLGEGRKVRRDGKFSVTVSSGIDWFDVHMQIDFDEVSVETPALLVAAQNRDAWVRLSDGTLGMLPEDWHARYGGLSRIAETTGDTIRFKKNQAALLDVWLSTMDQVGVDERFAKARERLQQLAAPVAVPAPAEFTGTLRPYQEEGVGWLHYLREAEFGGCLADDMGLGKTIQVLALLEARRAVRKREKLAPSLVVAPRSLIFNWQREAKRFTPNIRIKNHTGTDRSLKPGWEKKCDVLITTYGTLLRDIEQLKEIAFDYIVLDESQAIKNADALTSKAVRVLKGNHRIAMSGTPVENHLGELWSLFDFLNPGLLGNAAAFDRSVIRDPTPEYRAVLGRALRPFILRRTKAQVAKDLPERQEDTIYCELGVDQRQHYVALRDHYRKALLKRVDKDGLNKSKIVVLEALLRLRQAACHPALINPELATQPCAKFEVLLPQLEELAEEGHKALVFSQFTSYLELLQRELKARNMTYEYLDGKTKDRQARVDHFQQDEHCRLFLISLKAGGLGLNLTAADYVFLLDPWWNPAVEAQAIDRAHRIGQTRHVMAYRLIARDTVEEKVLALQESKRELAAAILNEDNAVLRNLTRDDLEFLLG